MSEEVEEQEADDRTTLMRRDCHVCKETKTLRVRGQDCLEYNRADRRHVQDVFPYLDSGERELLISGICGECFDKMFGEEES